MMWWWHNGSWSVGHWIEVGFMCILWIAVIIGIILLIRHAAERPRTHSQPTPPPGGQAQAPGQQVPGPQAPGQARSEALRILEERYARGEIDRKEFLERKADLTP
jgi:uncharacterized membrane protein